MLGPNLLLAWLAHVTFWVLIAWGWLTEELGTIRSLVFVALWFAGYFGLQSAPAGGSWFLSYVAVLDIMLVFALFRGDIRIT